MPTQSPPPLLSEEPPSGDDISAQYLEIRRRANAPSLPAWEGALQAGQDPGKVVLGIPLFDAIETRTDGEKVYKVGIDNDNPENSVVLETSDVGKAPVSAPAQVETDSVNPSTPISLLTGAGLGPDDYGFLGKNIGEAVSDTVIGVAKGAVRGLQEAGQQIGETFTGGYWTSDIEPWLHENIPYFSEIDKAFRVEAPKAGTQKFVASITAPVMQVIAPGAFLTKVFRSAGISSRFLSTALGYGTAEVVAVSPKDATILELGIQLIGDSSDIKKILEYSLGVQDDANAFILRLKNAPRRFLEGGPIGMVFERLLESVGMVYRVIKNSPNYEQYIQEMMGRKKVVAGPGAGEPPAGPGAGEDVSRGGAQRVNQSSFENDIRSGKITPDTPGVDPDEVRAILEDQKVFGSGGEIGAEINEGSP
tara:strand:+ start:126 stop:1385 length:1260 start_codon:yes stop_codon:yes gene_type:complete